MTHIKIGKIVATFGIVGEVILVHNLGQKSTFKNVEALFIEPTKNALLPYFLLTAKPKMDNECCILFEGIKSKETARMLIGKAVWLLQDDFKALSNQKSPIALLGYTVVSNNEKIGIVNEVIEQPHQILLTINYKNKEAYLPMHQDSLININHKTNEIFLNLPDGLLDIYV